MRQDEPVMRLCGVHLIIMMIRLKAIMASSSVAFSYFDNVDLLLSSRVIHNIRITMRTELHLVILGKG